MRAFFLLSASVFAAQPLHQVIDLSAGETQTVRAVPIKLVSITALRDPVENAVRQAEARIEVDGRAVTLRCGNYELPVTVGKVQVDCPISRDLYSNSNDDSWGLAKDARIRVWPAGSDWIDPATFGYPVRQRWFATQTQMSNEPTYVDHGETWKRRRIYYHSGLDIGGAEGMAEIVAATDGQIVSLGRDVLAGHEKDTPVDKRYDVIYLLDDRGWYYRYSHLHSFDPSLKLGARVKRGERMGLLGKEGGSGGWTHLHFEIKSRQPSSKWGTEEGYAFLWQAYLREHRPPVIAVARPHRVALIGEKAPLDASRSWAEVGIARYEWTLSNGAKARGARVERSYAKAGTYSEILKVTDKRGRVAYDFAVVDILDPSRRDYAPESIHATFHPTMGIKAGQPVTFQVRTFGTTDGAEIWNFGDRSAPVTTRSDGNVKMLAKDGYAITRHSFARPGDYLVSVGRGVATTHLWVRVE